MTEAFPTCHDEPEIGDAVLATHGAVSTVYAYNDAGKPAGRHGRFGAGHVCPFDLDARLDPGEIEAAFREAGITGPTVVLESSAGSYHAWNLAVRKFPRAALALEHYDDEKHLGVGRGRGYWRLRVGPKVTRDDRRYKPAPEIADRFVVYPEGHPEPVSSPHTLLLSDLFGAAIDSVALRYLDATGAGVVGDATELVQYATFTDTGKEIQRRSEGV